MGISYVNRCGDTYYLQWKLTKKGRTTYSFTRKVPKSPVDLIPEGFEIYESPDRGQVFLRKEIRSLILPEERAQTEAASRDLAGLTHCIVDLEEDALVIYTPDKKVEDADRLIRLLGGALAAVNRDCIINSSGFSKMLRFILDDPIERLFSVQRWCFRGSVEGWIWLTGPKKLPLLLRQFVPHLGKESFFELC